VAALTTGAPAPLQQQLPLPQQAYYYEPMMYGQPPGPTILSVDSDDQTPDGPPATTGQRNSVGNGSGQTYQQRQQGGYRPRQSRPTPQNIQRANYARQQQRQQPPADRNFNDRRQVRFNESPPDGGRHVETVLGTTVKAKSVTPPPRTADAAVSGATTPAAAGRLDVIDAVAGRPLPWRRSIGCPTRLEI
jgi:hypothetical protein